MNRIRFACFVTVILGCIYAFSGLMESLGHFSLGLIVAMLGVIGWGLTDFLEAHRDEKHHQERLAVWRRRDEEGW